MQVVMNYEISNGRKPKDVSKEIGSSQTLSLLKRVRSEEKSLTSAKSRF